MSEKSVEKVRKYIVNRISPNALRICDQMEIWAKSPAEAIKFAELLASNNYQYTIVGEVPLCRS